MRIGFLRTVGSRATPLIISSARLGRISLSLLGAVVLLIPGSRFGTILLLLTGSPLRRIIPFFFIINPVITLAFIIALVFIILLFILILAGTIITPSLLSLSSFNSPLPLFHGAEGGGIGFIFIKGIHEQFGHKLGSDGIAEFPLHGLISGQLPVAARRRL